MEVWYAKAFFNGLWGAFDRHRPFKFTYGLQLGVTAILQLGRAQLINHLLLLIQVKLVVVEHLRVLLLKAGPRGRA